MLKGAKPRILLLIDKPGWAFDICASEYTKYLSDEFAFEKKFLEGTRPGLIPFTHDLLHVFWWGERYYKRFMWPRNKILKEVSSHRWEDDPRYGPCTPEEMTVKYLSDAGTVLCTSRRLFDAISPHVPRICLANNGYSPDLFHVTEERRGRKMTMCWVGNVEDSVKGIKDILVPAAGDSWPIDIASNMKHSDLCEFYNRHDVFLVASRHEASPLPLMEAMACGCFPVCTDVGIVPELVAHKVNGYIVRERSVEAFREAFAWCADNLEFVRSAGKTNSALVYERRRWEVCAESFRAAYRKALSHE
jgi:hypothetical protein